MSDKNSQSSYEKALRIAAGEKFDHNQVWTLLEQAHNTGDARATYAIATWYLHGTHVEKDSAKAAQYLKEAADAGIAEAMADLAVSYEKGIGVDEDVEAAFEYYLRAALHGDDDAVFEVARCYYWGIGVGKDRRIANIWADRAEKLGVYEAEEAETTILKFPGRNRKFPGPDAE